MPDSAKRGLMLVKKETTYGTDPTPTAALNAIAVGNPRYTTDVTMLERDQILRDSLSRLSAIVGRKLARITYTVEMKGSGTAGTPPKHGPCLISCGMAETTAAGASVTYDPISSGFESMTVYFYDGSLLYEMNGCFSTVRIVQEVGNFGRYEFTTTGLWVLPVDAAVPASPVFDNTTPAPCVGLGFQLGSYVPVAATANFDLGIEIGERTDFNSPDGLKGLMITGRAVTGSVDPESVTEATHPFWSNFKNASGVALTGNLVGTTAGNKVAVTAPKLQYEAPVPADRNTIRTYNLPFRCNPSTDAADDEIQIIYT